MARKRVPEKGSIHAVDVKLFLPETHLGAEATGEARAGGQRAHLRRRSLSGMCAWARGEHLRGRGLRVSLVILAPGPPRVL